MTQFTQEQAQAMFDALILAEVQIEDFYTATMTNKLSRDENRAKKKAALASIRSTLEQVS